MNVKRYSTLGRLFRKLWRRFYPVPTTPHYSDHDDICSVKLVPEKELTDAFVRAIDILDLREKTCTYVEFGVFNGTSLACMMEAATIAKLSNLNLVGLDSFRGLPRRVAHEDGGVWHEGQFACSRAQYERCLADRGLDYNLVQIIEGWYEDVDHRQLAQAMMGESANIIMIDCDAYSSARKALEIIGDFIHDRVIVFFDDWRLNNVDLIPGGEYLAFHEWLESRTELECVAYKSYNRKSECVLVKRS